jgi:LCP family protein required for cell wall assembly
MSLEKDNVIKVVLISAIVIVFLAATLILVGILDKNYGIFPEQMQEDKVLEYKGEDYVLKKDVETFLILGLDKMSQDTKGDSYNNNQQADFLVLMVFDNSAKTYSAIHINRDTMAEIEVLGLAGNKVGTVNSQIALAHTYGKGGTVSNANTAKAVSKLLKDIKVNHYMSVTLDAVPIMNDLVGGVTVEVLDDFTDADTGLVKGETVTLTSEQALTYIRERQGTGEKTNVSRMKRQKQYIESMRDEIEKCIENDSEFMSDAVLKISDYMESDCSATRLQSIGKRLKSYEFVGLKEIEGEAKTVESDDGAHIEFYPDEDKLMQMVVGLFYEKK